MMDSTTTPSGPAARTGAARRPASSAPRRPRKPRTAAAVTSPVSRLGASPAVDASTTAKLAECLELLSADQRRWVQSYRPHNLSHDDWDVVRDLVQAAMASLQLPSAGSTRRLGSVLAFHARAHLQWGTPRTLSGWYSADAVERTLATASSSAGHRSLAGYAGRLRKAAQSLVPVPAVAPPATFRSYDPLGPYTTDELAQFLDDAEAEPKKWARQRLSMLVWLTVGTGVTPAEQLLLAPTCFEATPTALLLHVTGPTSRTIAVRTECEQPLIDLLADLEPNGSLYEGLEVGAPAIRLVAERAVRGPGKTRVTPTRLRATWLALVLSGPVPVGALLDAANIRGDRLFGHITRALQPSDPLGAIRALRGSNSPLADGAPELGVDVRHPAPQIPLMAVAP